MAGRPARGGCGSGRPSRCWPCCCSGAAIGPWSCRKTSESNWSTRSPRATWCRGSPIWRRWRRAQSTFVRSYAVAAVLCVLGIAGWLLLGLRAKWRPWLLAGLAALLLADLLWFAYGRSAQCDPALYYPRIPALEEVAKAAPGRIMGSNACLRRSPDARPARHPRLRRRRPGPPDRPAGNRQRPAIARVAIRLDPMVPAQGFDASRRRGRSALSRVGHAQRPLCDLPGTPPAWLRPISPAPTTGC